MKINKLHFWDRHLYNAKCRRWSTEVDLPRQITNTSSGILNFSTVLAKTNEFGGIIHSDVFLVTKFVGLKFFGSTISEFTFVKILNSSETLAS